MIITYIRNNKNNKKNADKQAYQQIIFKILRTFKKSYGLILQATIYCPKLL